MGTYVNIKCGNCGHSLTGGHYRAGTLDNLSRLGPEHLPCGHCGTKNSSGRIPFTKMDILEKAWVLLLVAFNGLVIGGMAGAFIGHLFFKSPGNSDENTIIGLVCGFLIAATYLIYRFLHGVKKDGYWIKQLVEPHNNCQTPIVIKFSLFLWIFLLFSV